MADRERPRPRGRDEESDEDFVELACYQSWSEVDMLAPRLEEDGIRYEAREEDRNPDDFHDELVQRRTSVRVLVPRRQLRRAREVYDDFEAQRDVSNYEVMPQSEPEDVGGPDDMEDQPKMKF